MSDENELPNLSFGFMKTPPPEHDGPGRPVREITEGKLLYLSLDLWPGPFGSKAEPVQLED